MLRTQISLTVEERRALDAVAARTGRSISALIREAVETVYGVERSSADDLAAMRRAFGSWTDRDVDGAAWADRLRPGSRPAPRAVTVLADTSPLVDTSVLIDYLRGHHGAAELLERERATAPLHASEITRLEVLAGMRTPEQDAARLLLSTLTWHPVDEQVAEEAGALGRRWLPSHHHIDSADLAIAATAILGELRLLTLNVRHFPMLPDLQAPY